MDYLSVGFGELRRVAAAMPTGVVLLTVASVPEGYGTTIGTFVAVSFEPPLVSVCLQAGCRTLELIPLHALFGISVLTSEHAELARRYARRDRPRGLADLPLWSGRHSGVLTLASAAAGFECRTVRHVEAGDHVLVLASVSHAWRTDAVPLLHLDHRLVPAGTAHAPQVA